MTGVNTGAVAYGTYTSSEINIEDIKILKPEKKML